MKDYIGNIQDLFKEMVREHGYPLHMGSKFCQTYLSRHENCKGCESEAGCSRYTKLMGLAAKKMITPSDDNRGFDLKDKQVMAEIRKILDTN